MTIRLVVISGGLASGKSVLAERLHAEFGCRVVNTSEIIRSHQSNRAKGNRLSLQRKGNELDRKTDFGWIADHVAREIRPGGSDSPVVLEGVRKPRQIDRILTRIGHRHVRHVHLSVDLATQKKRFESSNRKKDVGLQFEAAINDASEREVATLAAKADIVIPTERHTEADVFHRVSARLNLQSRSSDRLVDVLVGGQYGSEGKGNIADYLSPEYDVLMRVGGPNAGHKVYEDPPYTHISLPCGTRNNESQTLLIGPGAVIEPRGLLEEIRDCEVEAGRLIVDEQAVLILPEDREWEKQHLEREIGSTARGVGKATARRVTDRFRNELRCKLAKDVGPEFNELRPYLGATAERFRESIYKRREGSSGGYPGHGPKHVPRRLPLGHVEGYDGVRVSLGGRNRSSAGEPDRAGMPHVPNTRRGSVRQLLQGDRLGDGFGAVGNPGGGIARPRSRLGIGETAQGR